MDLKPYLSNIPEAANKAMAQEGVEIFKNEDYLPQKLVECVFGNSSYLALLMQKHSSFLKRVFTDGFEKSFEDVQEEIRNFDYSKTSKEKIMSFMRQNKGRISLLTALADIMDYWEVGQVTSKLSIFADNITQLATNYLIQKRISEGQLGCKSAGDSGFFILSVGKMGSGELNYSSDIDLIVLYDEDKVNYTGRLNMRDFFIRLTQEFIALLQDKTSDGYVFRVDLRLRPDPFSTPIAVSTKTAETYYENVGQNWERAAMIKARFASGDESCAEKYLEFLGRFIWRKYLDFNALNDIHSIKRQIDSSTSYNPGNLYEYDVKLGKGGIREIEFFIQVQQLIWGGKEEVLRSKSTPETLQNLVELGRIEQEICDELTNIYKFLRKTEHRLQMVADEHTHSLPRNAEGLEAFSIFMGYKKAENFEKELGKALSVVQRNYAELFVDSPNLGAGGNLVFTGVSNDPETMITLAKLGFEKADVACEIIRGWHHGRRRATRFKRVREILTELVPNILSSFANSTKPDDAMTRFDDFLAELPSSVQIFNLFDEKPELVSLIAEIMGNSPWLAENLSRSPALVTRILSIDFQQSSPTYGELEKSLASALEDGDDYDQKLKILRRWKHEMEFLIGIQFLKQMILYREAGNALSDIAEIVLAKVLEMARAEYAQKIKGEIAIIGMGRLGTRELTFASDLDIVLVYEPAAGESAAIYERFAKKFTGIFSKLSADGILYPVDTRLRPSGNQGALATSLESYKKYYAESAWNWEFLALTKAKVIGGSKPLQRKLIKIIVQTLQSQRDEQTLAKDIGDMRQKIAAAFSDQNPWDVKYAIGGLFEIEFIIQYLKLKHSTEYKKIVRQFGDKFWEFLQTNNLMSPVHVADLQSAHEFLNKLQSIVRLTSKTGVDPESSSDKHKALVTSFFKENEFEELEKRLINSQKIINKHFNSFFNEGSPAPQNKGDSNVSKTASKQNRFRNWRFRSRL